MTQITLGAGYSITVSHDDCGCQITLDIAHFDGATKAFDDRGNMSVEYVGNPHTVARLTVGAGRPEGQEREILPTTTIELVDIEEHELDGWLYEPLSPWIRFERTGTLAQGCDRCDFQYHRVPGATA